MIKYYQVTFDSGDENSFKVHIGDKIVKFPDNYDMIYLSKPDKNFFINVAEEGGSKIIKRLNRL